MSIARISAVTGKSRIRAVASVRSVTRKPVGEEESSALEPDHEPPPRRQKAKPPQISTVSSPAGRASDAVLSALSLLNCR